MRNQQRYLFIFLRIAFLCSVLCFISNCSSSTPKKADSGLPKDGFTKAEPSEKKAEAVSGFEPHPVSKPDRVEKAEGAIVVREYQELMPSDAWQKAKYVSKYSMSKPEEYYKVSSMDEERVTRTLSSPSRTSRNPLRAQASQAAEASRAQADAVDTYLKSLGEANVVFNRPRDMKVNSHESIHVWLDPSKPLSQLIDNFKSELRIIGDVEGKEKIKWDTKMMASLEGPAFRIAPDKPQIIDAVTENTGGKWHWDVTALQPGERQKLTLKLYVFMTINGQERQKEIKTMETDIYIKTTFGYWWDKYGPWTTSTLLIPFVSWVWVEWKGRRKEKKGQ